ncbi:50S ribosomal protein L28 [Candidatus Parcubacteria bacterium]|nr:MAG: 50S ribosomal protein L28 [Candidatus Parcubacteria bacterium]
MAKVCEICQKRAMIGNIRSHSNIASKRKMKVNLQSKKIGNKRITACTSCLKTIKKLQKNRTA